MAAFREWTNPSLVIEELFGPFPECSSYPRCDLLILQMCGSRFVGEEAWEAIMVEFIPGDMWLNITRAIVLVMLSLFAGIQIYWRWSE